MCIKETYNTDNFRISLNIKSLLKYCLQQIIALCINYTDCDCSASCFAFLVHKRPRQGILRDNLTTMIFISSTNCTRSSPPWRSGRLTTAHIVLDLGSLIWGFGETCSIASLHIQTMCSHMCSIDISVDFQKAGLNLKWGLFDLTVWEL